MLVVDVRLFRLGQQLVEQVVLGRFELADAHGDLGPMAEQCVGVTLCVLVLATRQWRFRHKRPQARVIGDIGKVGKLFLGDSKLFPQPHETLGHLAEAALEPGPRHDERS